MKKSFLIKVLIFVFLMPVVWLLGVAIWGTFMPHILQKNIYYRPAGSGHTLTRLREADTIKGVDILVIGSSHAYRGIDPRIFEKHGIKTFNLGTSSQTPIQTQYLLNHYIDKIKPRVVLYEVYFSTFQADGVESALDLYSNVSKIDKDLFKMAVELDNVKSYNTFAYAFLNQLFIKKKYNEPIIKGLDTYVKGGYVERKLVANTVNDDEPVAGKNFAFNDKQLKAFDQILELLKQKNIKLVLLQTPITKRSYLSIKNLITADRYFSSVQTAGYYNFNTTTDFNDSYFYDSHHLNQVGVNKFDELLIDTLMANKKIMPYLLKK